MKNNRVRTKRQRSKRKAQNKKNKTTKRQSKINGKKILGGVPDDYFTFCNNDIFSNDYEGCSTQCDKTVIFDYLTRIQEELKTTARPVVIKQIEQISEKLKDYTFLQEAFPWISEDTNRMTMLTAYFEYYNPKLINLLKPENSDFKLFCVIMHIRRIIIKDKTQSTEATLP